MTSSRQRRRTGSYRVRQPVEELVKGDWIITHANASGVIDRVSNGSGHSADAQLSNALRLHGRGDWVGLIEKDHFLVRNVGMNRHFVAGEIMVDEEAQARVNRECLH